MSDLRRPHFFKVLIPCVALYLGATACASLFGIQGGELSDGSTTGDGSSNGDALPYDGSGKDVIDLGDANFAQCPDGGTDDTTGAIYVSNSHKNRNSSASLCGSPTVPCSSIQTAIAKAVGTPEKKVILANDAFDEVLEFDQTTNGVLVEGGYFLDYGNLDGDGNPAWVYQCATSLAHIVPQSSPKNYTVHFNGATGNTLRLLTVETRPTAIAFGESLHAILVTNSTLTLDNVVAVAQNGGDGMAGNPGATQTSCITASGNGGAGAGGPAGGQGQFTANGYTADLASNGVQGQTGMYTPPEAGTCEPNCGTFCLGNQTSDGGPTCGPSTSYQCGGPGGTGCAGAGGFGGYGGQGGGGSIAVYVAGGSDVLLVNGTTLFANSGGGGGAGGSGSAGAVGDAGGPGSQTTCIDSCGPVDGGTCGATSSHKLGAGTPGSGSAGGAGGVGGGGRGGPAYLLVRVDPASVTGSGLVSNGDGGLGAGGAGGLPNGANGDQQRYRVYP